MARLGIARLGVAGWDVSNSPRVPLGRIQLTSGRGARGAWALALVARTGYFYGTAALRQPKRNRVARGMAWHTITSTTRASTCNAHARPRRRATRNASARWSPGHARPPAQGAS